MEETKRTAETLDDYLQAQLATLAKNIRFVAFLLESFSRPISRPCKKGLIELIKILRQFNGNSAGKDDIAERIKLANKLKKKVAKKHIERLKIELEQALERLNQIKI